MTDIYDSRKDSFESYNVWVASQRAKLLHARCPAAKRIEVIGSCELYLGDCMEIMPTLERVDAVVTDPPYGIDYGKQGSFSASHGWGPWRENVSWDAERPGREIFDLMRSASKDQIIWGGNYFTDYLPPTMQWLVWDKGQRDFSLADGEFAWSSQNKAARIFTYSRSKAKQDGKQHPTQKPIALMKWCLEFVPKARTVLDPFMGSGTTGVACANVGRRFIGIEREPSYFDIACERIRKAYRQPDLFVDQQAESMAEQIGFALDGGASD
ncbi:DNA-methyltransferase [Sinorhizobium meliloti]|uniref:DNA-methyltransferase n=1 Tax=Rhizobium meliloti TaxID=382 RepID=UPI000FD9DB98|nr:site-specific DNA-methyltransferase [Sinorhizobium meliloti]RVG29735.1 site-specific DNA-methyltransferase [Sinorhizobium meliloti]